MKLSLAQQLLLSAESNDPKMLNAIKKGVYYADITPCISGYAMGHFDFETGECPALSSTLAQAQEEHNSIANEYIDQINQHQRDKDDLWQGIVMKILWNGADDVILIEDDQEVHRGSWRELSGI